MTDGNYTLIPTHSDDSRGFVDLVLASKLSGMHPEMIIELTRANFVVAARKDRAGNL